MIHRNFLFVVVIGRRKRRRNLKAYLLLMINGVFALRRGPHHPPGQTPVERPHHHYKPMGTGSFTGDSQLLHDAKHLEEDSKVLTPAMLASMTPEELEFHYFSIHDFDRNTKLDGSEMLKAVYHTLDHESPNPDDDSSIEPEANDLDSFIVLVDRTLQFDDTDGDGYVSYPEYRAARARNPSKKASRILDNRAQDSSK
ncbi:multiple coagulation factor deficiency protein 2 homolog isoform X1 [Bombyx mori]|uniref:Multiple coagulation factor deficiency 2-like protein n=2 Tax=Bombyx mori TaxID=7091 RepID=A0A8R2HQY5_BOMMO|nr:multiple coagulation factor deficiency protein 2 homolog isoform X1 [Bombyx mori]